MKTSSLIIPWRIWAAWACVLITIHAPAFTPPSHPELPNFDRRSGASPAQAAADKDDAIQNLQRLVPAARVTFDEILATPRWVRSERGFLSGAGGAGGAVKSAAAAAISPGESHLPTKAFLQEHAALFGFGPEILGTAQIKREFETAHSGLKTVVWEQKLDGITVFEGLLISHTTRSNELVSISSRFLPNLAQAADAALTNRALLQENPTVTAPEAVIRAAENVGANIAPTEISETSPPGADAEKRQRFQATPLNGNAEVRLVWLPMAPNRMRLCWEVLLTSRARGEMFQVLIDADRGEALVRHGLTEYISPATYNVYTSDSPSPFSPGHQTPLTSQPPVVSRTLVTLSAIDTNASPNGWIDDGGNQTLGNNVDAHTDRDNNDSPDLPRPQGAPFRTFNFALDLTQAPATYTNAAVTDLFYWNNWMHDQLYKLGFTEAAGNFQTTNFGRGGLGNDAVQADAQDGGGFNNANMNTPPDGSAPRMQMYLFDGPTPDRDGDFDHEIVLHEYTHGLSNRRVGGGVGLSALQSRGMGEGWSDWYGLSLLSEPGDDVNAAYAAGGYATLLFSGLPENYYFGIRRYPYSTDMSKNPLTFRDIDSGQASTHAGIPRSPVPPTSATSVHNQGEVWCVTLWEARAKLINKHGYAVGNELILRLVTDGMNLSPANPNFLESRDAILQADVVLTGGANLGELWAAFAKRGMGFGATSPSSSTTSGLVESYVVPDALAVFPGSGLTGVGPVGGPFVPSTKPFTLVNSSGNLITWAGAVTVPWVSLSQSNGVLVAGGTNAVNLVVNSLANSLGAGIYNGTARFSNETSGVTQTRSITLRVGQPDTFTELFDAADFDLDNQTLTFTPNGSSNYYSVCREPAFALPTNPAGGTNLALGSHSSLQLTLPNNISIYGRSTNIIFLASEGHITLNSADTSGTMTLANHFSRPRVSASMAHLHPGENGGTVSRLQLPDRVVITFNNVTDFNTGATNRFQMELFYDGRIRMTHLAMGSTAGLVGLSAGTGIPAGYVESDLGGYGPCLLPMLVTVPHNTTEGDGVLVGQGQVNIFSPAAADVTVNLASSDSSEVTVPATVTVLAGQTTADFDVTIIDDADLDGTKSATITASAAGYFIATDEVQVVDSENATLSVSVPANVTEGSAPFSGTVLVSAAPAANVNVSLSSSDTTELQVPASVILLAGQTSASFNITIVNDSQIDGDQIATITAQVANWTDGATNVTVGDNEPTNLVVTLPATAREGNGLLVGVGRVRISGTMAADLTVDLLSSDTSELSVPASATIIAGQTSVLFDVTVENDPDIDSTQPVTVTASAPGFSPGGTNMLIYDDESPPAPATPSPAHLATNVLQTSDLAWQSGAVPGEVITNEVYFGTNPTPGAAEFQGSTTASNWALPTLYPQTTYYWQVVARKTGVTAGPVWQFTTRGIDHFTWNPVASPQYVGQPFSATITAKDAFETTVSNFTGTVNLSAAGSGASSNVMLGNVMHTGSGAPTYTLGFAITPSTNITVTHVRSYSGTKVSIWTSAGVLVASQNVSGTPTVWTETALSNSVTLLAGTTYRVGYYTGGATYYFNTNRPTTFAHGTFVNGYYYIASDGFPTTFFGTDTVMFLCDLRYTTGISSSVPFPFTPTVSGSFSNGTWTGNLTALAPATNVALRADDGNSHTGLSTAFAVQLQNDITVSVTDAPDPVSLGGNLTYTITVTNIGPAAAAGVTVTNLLPATASVVSVTASQGSSSTNGNVVVCNLGTMSGNASATVVIVAAPTGAGTLTNQTSVSRSDTDAYLANNTAVVATTVQVPTIAINDVSMFEGNAGMGTATFTVTVTPAPALPVGVLFATAAGSAAAPADFLSTNGVLNFAPGQTNQTISVRVIGDALYELNETFTVNLSGATNANLADSQGAGTLLNDDPIPTLSIGDAYLVEGNAGTTNAVFPVVLSTASGLGVTVNYATVAGNATSGSDYNGVSSSLTIPAGATSNSIAVAILGDLQIEPDEVFYVDLSAAANATLLKREGVGFIVNDDGLPGQLDHFAWNPLAPTQYVGLPFGVSITALDAFENPATSFTGPATLNASAGLQVTNRILGNLVHSSTASGNFTMGYSFTPNASLTVTHVRSYFGTKVSIWTDAGVLVATRAVSGTLGTWTETPLASPVTLNAGTTYRVGVYNPSGTYYWRTDGAGTFSNGAINFTYSSSGDVFPTASDTARWWFVDLRYTVGNSAAVPINPVITGNFTNGIWAGNLTVLAAATNLVLGVSDGNSHVGFSTPMMVELRNDIAVTISDAPDPVTVDGNINYLITVANIGPAVATGVMVTNLLPPAVVPISVTSSQGNTTTNGNVVVGNLGLLAADASATMAIVARAVSAGAVTNLVTVYRAEADALLANNSATAVTSVQVPALSVGNASGAEGNAGATNLFVFTVSLSVAPVTNVSVNFATVNGTASAGSDYIATNGVLNFAPGQTSQTFAVRILGDTVNEPHEVFSVVLSNAINAVIATATGTGTIINDESTGIVAFYTDGTPTVTGWAAPIAQAGFIPLHISNIATFALTNLDTLVIDEYSSVSSALLAKLPAIQAWVVGGGKLVVHDRSPSGTPFLLGTTGITPVASSTANLDVIPPATNVVVAGPYGTINNSTLDGGSSSGHGYVVQSQLPVGATPIISVGGNSSNVVCFSYPLGSGMIYYSAIPLDCYLGTGDCIGNTIATSLRTIYAPNVLVYVSGLSSGMAPPAINNQPAGQNILIGGTANFTVGAFGAQPLSYQWRKNAVPIPGATNISYGITGAQTNDAGNYSVIVTNSYGAATSSVAVLAVIALPSSGEFQIVALKTNNSSVVDHNSQTGDDRGGIAASASRVLYSGDSSTARFALGDLSGGTALGQVYDALASDLRTGTIYSLGNGLTPLTSAGGTVTTLLPHDGTSGMLTTNAITLSTPISLPASGSVGIFAGFGRIVVHTGSRVYDILVPTGIVVDRGPMSALTARTSENWAFWGVAEYFGGTLYLTYVRDSQTIMRTAVPTGVTSTLAAFSNLSDMACFTVSLLNNRWYFHYEGSGQFGGSSETIGFADAIFSYMDGSNAPAISAQPANQTARTGGIATFSVTAFGSGPLSYQWRKGISPLPSQTNATLTLLNVQTSDAGNYNVLVTNLYGSVLSSNALLTVTTNVAQVSLFFDSTYVDVGTSTSGEATNLFAAIVARGYAVQTFTGITPAAFSNALAGGGILFIPELEVNDLGAALTAAAKSVISNFVRNGGSLIINGQNDSRDEGFVNQVFGYSIGAGSGSSGSLLSGAGAGTAFAGGPSSLPENNGSYEWLRATLPAGGLSIYEDSGAAYTSVAMIPHGTGKIIFLAYDWYDAVPRGTQDGGWDDVLRRALLEATPLAPTLIVGQPQSQSVGVGGTASFCLQATSGAPLNYLWRRDGVAIPGATQSCYTITNCQLVDSGRQFSCLVSNALGSIISSNASLTVTNSQPPALKFRPVEKQNGSLRLVVTTENESPIPPARGSNIWVYASTNSALPLSAWVPLPIAPVLTNGVLVIDGVNLTNQISHPVRFFRAMEMP